jgi:hypothetical protein
MIQQIKQSRSVHAALWLSSLLRLSRAVMGPRRPRWLGSLNAPRTDAKSQNVCPVSPGGFPPNIGGETCHPELDQLHNLASGGSS